ncbi:MAG: hypothetical protein A2054_06725 [Deltaproteobacteria bacterium GWA2_55_10]|nr:MAG: hypothetical protein A2054_06725 [Deltaproteobacteria bacterium GWA2_55_10]
MDRMKHVADSVELQNITLKSSLIEIISLLQSIISNETNIEYEMILWSLLSTELIESEKFDRAIKTLMDKDRLVIADYEDLRSVGFWSRESPWDIHYSTGKDILKCIITPNLMVKMGEAMDKKK